MAEVDTKSPPAATTEGTKQNTNNNEVDQSQFPSQGPSGQPFPPPNFAFYNYPPGHPPPPPGPDGNPDPNAPPPNGEPIPYPPGMYPYVYSQPPPGYMPVSMAGMPIPGALIKPKRKQVKMACTNCAAACKRCDVGRPCERCIKYGLAESCRDGVRKERKKGFKRGPYNKRKRQEEREAEEWEAAQNNPNGEWTPAGPNGTPFPGPPPQGPFPPPPEGYYPAFYLAPPPGSGPPLVPIQHGENNEGQDGSVDPNVQGQNGDSSQPPHPQPPFPPPHAQFVYPPHLPPGYPFYFPPPQHPPPHTQPTSQQTTQHVAGQPSTQAQDQQQETPAAPHVTGNKKKRSAIAAEVAVKDDDDEEEDPPTPPRKKRGRRSSDADWPGVSKKSTKKDGAPGTRRSTRRGPSQAQTRGQHRQDSMEGSPNHHMDSNNLTESIVNASNHEIVGSTEDQS